MTTLTVPAGVTAMANLKLVFCPTGSLTAPSVATFTGGSALDISCYAYNWAPTKSGNKVTAPRRVCSSRVFQKLGLTQEDLGNVQYMIDPQATAGTTSKLAYEKMAEGNTGYLLERWGLDSKTVDLAIGQFVVVRAVTCGPQFITGDITNEASEIMVDQTMGLTAAASPLLAMVA